MSQNFWYTRYTITNVKEERKKVNECMFSFSSELAHDIDCTHTYIESNNLATIITMSDLF